MASVVKCTEVVAQEVTDNDANGLQYRLIFDAKERRLLTNYVNVVPGGNTRSHSHDWEHVSYVIEGEGVLESGEGKILKISAGTAVHIPGGERHCFRNTGTETLVIFGVLGPMPSEE